MERSINQRVAGAESFYQQQKEASKPGDASTITALISLRSRLPGSEILSVARKCGSTPAQIHRTFAEMQVSFGVPEGTDAEVELKLAKQVLGQLDFMRLAPKFDDDSRRIKSDTAKQFEAFQERAFLEARTDAASGKAPMNGVLVRGTFASIECMRSAFGSRHLATEVLGRQIPFAIPLEIPGR